MSSRFNDGFEYEIITSNDVRVLRITIPLHNDLGLSKSGKSITVATSHGFITLEKEPAIFFNLNVNKKLEHE